MGKASAPPAPDYAGAAQAQGAANVETARQEGYLRNPNVLNPYGSQSVTFDPTTGQPTTVQSLSPDQQRLFNAQGRLSENVLGVGEAGVNRVGQAMATPFDTSALNPITTSVASPNYQSSYGNGGAIQYGLRPNSQQPQQPAPGQGQSPKAQQMPAPSGGGNDKSQQMPRPQGAKPEKSQSMPTPQGSGNTSQPGFAPFPGGLPGQASPTPSAYPSAPGGTPGQPTAMPSPFQAPGQTAAPGVAANANLDFRGLTGTQDQQNQTINAAGPGGTQYDPAANANARSIAERTPGNPWYQADKYGPGATTPYPTNPAQPNPAQPAQPLAQGGQGVQQKSVLNAILDPGGVFGDSIGDVVNPQTPGPDNGGSGATTATAPVKGPMPTGLSPQQISSYFGQGWGGQPAQAGAAGPGGGGLSSSGFTPANTGGGLSGAAPGFTQNTKPNMSDMLRGLSSGGQIPGKSQGMPSPQSAYQTQTPTGGGAGDRFYSPNEGGQIQTGVAGADPAARQHAEDMAYQSATSRLDPQFQQAQAAQETQLRNQGLVPGSEAYDSAMRNFNVGKNDAYGQAQANAVTQGLTNQQAQFGMGLAGGQFANTAQAQGYGQNLSQQQAYNAAQAQANSQNASAAGFNNQVGQQQFNQGLANANLGNQATQQQIQQQAYLRSLPLNELNALRSGAQVQNPQFQQYQGANVGQAPIFNAAQAQGQWDQGIFNANQSSANATTGAIGSIAGMAAMFF